MAGLVLSALVAAEETSLPPLIKANGVAVEVSADGPVVVASAEGGQSFVFGSAVDGVLFSDVALSLER